MKKIYFLFLVISFSFASAQIQPSAIDYLDTNNVKAAILCNSDFGWDLTNGQYEVPKGSGKHALHCGSLWIGGYHNGVLRMAANTYRQNGQDFWPGPLDTTNASINIATSNQWNQLWKISRSQLDQFIQQWNLGNVQNGSYIPPSVIVNWPAHGSGNLAKYLAPFVDVNGDGFYNPVQDGDYPLIKGDQMIWWVINDMLASHTETGAGQIGVEIHCSAYSYNRPCVGQGLGVLNNTTFYNYKIINRTPDILDSVVVGFFIDADLGNPLDDYVGSDVAKNMAFTYNANNTDAVYGNAPPAFSVLPLKGPLADENDNICNDRDSCIDCTWPIDTLNCQKTPGIGLPFDDNQRPEQIAMSSFIYADNTTPWALINSVAYYRMLNARWNNGTHLTWGGNGTNLANPSYNFAFSGYSDYNGWGFGYQPGQPPISPPNSVPWTEHDLVRIPGERKMFVGLGKFTLKPFASKEAEFALVFSQDNSCPNNLCALALAREDADTLTKLFNCSVYPQCSTGIGMEERSSVDFKIYPVPANETLTIASSLSKVEVKFINVLGKTIKKALFSGTYQFEIGNIPNGIYFLEISDSSKVYTRKVIIQH